MVTIATGEWIVDLGAMACRNINKRIEVRFKKKVEGIIGKLKICRLN